MSITHPERTVPMVIALRSFLRRHYGCARLAVVAQLEYRMNFVIDAVFQPIISALIEILLWWSIFRVSGEGLIGGFGKASYLSYALWGAFSSRIATNWMYEFRMVREVEQGTVNSVLVRPVSFFEYYFGQFLGYKLLCAGFSILVPIACTLLGLVEARLALLPVVALLGLWHLVFVYLMSYCMAGLSFFTTRVSTFTVLKNISLWVFSGEMFPLDLLPAPFRETFLYLPFASATFVPVGVLTGRLDPTFLLTGFVSVTAGIVLLAILGKLIWFLGLRAYGGTGA